MATIVPLDRERLELLYTDAIVWAKSAYTAEGRDYWRGVRDTLGVLLGYMIEKPLNIGPGTNVPASYLL